MVSSVTIAGIPCRMTRPISWSLYPDVNYRIQSIPMMPKDAETILAIDNLVNIKFAGRSGKTLEFRDIKILGEGQAPDPFTRVVEFTDKRYFWKDKAFSRNFNETISSATVRSVAPDGSQLTLKAGAVGAVTAKKITDLTFAGSSMIVTGK